MFVPQAAGRDMAEPDTKDLDALLGALNRSAERLQTLWFTFLGITIYFAVAALTTTHRMLLLNEEMSLPVVNMKVKLLPFYVIAPLFYVIIHFYALMMLVLLARTTAPFEGRLVSAFPREADQERYRSRAENALFLQMLIGPKPERSGINGNLLATIALVTLAIAPVAVLALMQLTFLPYHSLAITWWHRLCVCVDFALVVTLWLSYRDERGATRLLPPVFRKDRPADWRWQTCCHATGLFAVVWLSLWEGRWAGEDWIGRKDFTAKANGLVFGAFPDRLQLSNEIIVGEKLLAEKKKELRSRGGTGFVPTRNFDDRDFQAAVLRGADLRGVALGELLDKPTTLNGADLQRRSCRARFSIAH